MPGEARITREDGTPVCERCVVADSPLRRLRGLLGRAGLAPGEGLLLRPAPAVHTFFMRFPIDAVFLDGDLCVVGVAPALRPWRWAGRARARSTLELAAGEAAQRGVEVGERLTVSSRSGVRR